MGADSEEADSEEVVLEEAVFEEVAFEEVAFEEVAFEVRSVCAMPARDSEQEPTSIAAVASLGDRLFFPTTGIHSGTGPITIPWTILY